MSSSPVHKRPSTPAFPPSVPAAKRQKSSPPPTPPFSHDLPTLPPDIQKRIIFLSIDPYREQDISNHDPRYLNPNFRDLLNRKRWITRLADVCTTWRTWVEHLLRQPAVVLDYRELARLAGGRWRLGKGKKPVRDAVIGREWMERIWEPVNSSRRIMEVLCWMTVLPEETRGRGLGLEERRWPKWYLEDYMRYDLARLGVRILRVVAPNGATLASLLTSTVPNHAVLHTLHLEIYHPFGPVHASDPNFFNAFRKQPETDHLCPRISLHSLHTLRLRNIPACAALLQPTHRLHISFVNAHAGLCTPPATYQESYHSICEFQTAMIYGPTLEVLVVVAGDYWDRRMHFAIAKQPGRKIWSGEPDMWRSLATGIMGWAADEEDEEQEFVDTDEEEEELVGDGEEGRTPVQGRTAERWIAPKVAQQTYRPLKIMG